ncbi:hypothetical protein GMORB2_7720 [Geosmithia morbida]|uniref:Uncharacterized protein n=1 Tax=Geosmithia morbida TaxID=1094350 RepID=A0A9P4YT96_9HYPO|nr:uncharacterized protein GMORB2_7720 [Geosmithia morbida]KAF4122127.1 hypothetical protein GMORB2_7720 [Geosmithia morbida]
MPLPDTPRYAVVAGQSDFLRYGLQAARYLGSILQRLPFLLAASMETVACLTFEMLDTQLGGGKPRPDTGLPPDGILRWCGDGGRRARQAGQDAPLLHRIQDGQGAQSAAGKGPRGRESRRCAPPTAVERRWLRVAEVQVRMYAELFRRRQIEGGRGVSQGVGWDSGDAAGICWPGT